MTDGDTDLRARAAEMDGDWLDRLNDRADGGGGCMELAEALTELRDK